MNAIPDNPTPLPGFMPAIRSWSYLVSVILALNFSLCSQTTSSPHATGSGVAIPNPLRIQPPAGKQPQNMKPEVATSTATPQAKTKSYSFNIQAAQTWLNTEVDVASGDHLRIDAGGSLSFPDGKTAGPDGKPRGWKDLLRSLPVNGAGLGALVGRVGEEGVAVPFFIGSSHDIAVPGAGRLYLGLNTMCNDVASGDFVVTFEIVATVAPVRTGENLTELLKPFLKDIPQRVEDRQGSPGDMVNFVLVGSEQQKLSAFENAGWVKVDRTKEEAAVNAILHSPNKSAYVNMPMSELYLFGRAQDYGMARAEPIRVIAERHHLRLWHAPFQINGKETWVGAATHDIGFDTDQRNGNVTHKIDPDVDKERDYLKATFSQAGQLSNDAYATPLDPLREAKTAHGEEFFSDGRLLVMVLKKPE